MSNVQNGEARRRAVEEILAGADGPVSAGALAKRLAVSRQIIVGDVALLRAGGADISATPRGYVMGRSAGVEHTLACVHPPQQMGEELYAIVDAGGEVVDVIVEHPVYGQLTGNLGLRSRYDVDAFLRRIGQEEAHPLSELTGGIHLHTVRCPDEETFLRVRKALGEAGLLLKM